MLSQIKLTQIIFYVANQKESSAFYSSLFRQKPDLDVPGMTEFIISHQCKLGLMPADGIAKIVCPALPHPSMAHGIPRCELYLYVDDIRLEFHNAITAGGQVISAIEERNWGDTVCYLSDPDGHVIAFAVRTEKI